MNSHRADNLSVVDAGSQMHPACQTAPGPEKIHPAQPPTPEKRCFPGKKPDRRASGRRGDLRAATGTAVANPSARSPKEVRPHHCGEKAPRSLSQATPAGERAGIPRRITKIPQKMRLAGWRDVLRVGIAGATTTVALRLGGIPLQAVCQTKKYFLIGGFFLSIGSRRRENFAIPAAAPLLPPTVPAPRARPPCPIQPCPSRRAP